MTPERLPEAHARYIAALQERVAERTRELGSEVAQEPPAWATKTLGMVPEDAMERLEWESKAGAVAAFREAVGFDDAERAIPSAPGLTNTEKRAAWWDAWEALGKPSETRAEAALSEGRLQARVSAWQREQQWAPAHADASMRQAELDAEKARTDGILVEAAGDTERAAELRAEADRLSAVARGMTDVAKARAGWAAETAVTRDLAERAERELSSRGLTPGAELDRVSAEEWLAEHRRSVEAEDEIRPVTELDVPANDEQAVPVRPQPVVEDEVELQQPSPAYAVAPVEPTDLELEALVHTAAEAEERIADREREEAAHDAMEAEVDVAPEFDGPELDGPDLGDVAELSAPVSLGSAFKPWPEDD